MDQEQLAAQVGRRYVRNGVFVGLGLAVLVFILISGGDVGSVFRLIGNWPIQTFICVVIGPVIGHLVGAWAGKKILLHDWNAWLLSPMLGFACVWVTTFLFSLVGYFDEGRHGSYPENEWRDYVLNPMILVTMFGGLFILSIGFVMAAFFTRAREKHFTPQP